MLCGQRLVYAVYFRKNQSSLSRRIWQSLQSEMSAVDVGESRITDNSISKSAYRPEEGTTIAMQLRCCDVCGRQDIRSCAAASETTNLLLTLFPGTDRQTAPSTLCGSTYCSEKYFILLVLQSKRKLQLCAPYIGCTLY